MIILEQKIRDNKAGIEQALRENMKKEPAGVCITSKGELHIFAAHMIFMIAEQLKPQAILMLAMCEPHLTPEENFRRLVRCAKEIDRETLDDVKRVMEMIKGK